MDQSVIIRLLPAVYGEVEESSDLLRGLIEVMQDLHQPPEESLENVELYFRSAPVADRFLPALASWLDLEWLLTGEQKAGRETYRPGTMQLRRLIDQAANLSSWRGTATGLVRFLEVATGVEGFQVSSTGERPFHVAVWVPPEAAQFAGLVERIVSEQKPVCATHDVEFGSVGAKSEGETDHVANT